MSVSACVCVCVCVCMCVCVCVCVCVCDSDGRLSPYLEISCFFFLVVGFFLAYFGYVRKKYTGNSVFLQNSEYNESIFSFLPVSLT